MNSLDSLGVGFYGKIPSLGDFVSRRLPRQFIEPWDQWLQSSMLASQQILGSDWLAVFLVSPIWRFALSPGICGSSAWAGVVMPSVDRVGRYFPLTLVQAIDEKTIPALFLPESDWFTQLEHLALSVLNDDFNFEAFDQVAMAIQLDQHLPPLCYKSQSPETVPGNSGKQVFRFDMDNLNQTPGLYPIFAQTLLEKLFVTYSFWAGTDTRLQKSRFLCCEGIPSVDAYASFLQGSPEDRYWNLNSYRFQPATEPSAMLTSGLMNGAQAENTGKTYAQSWLSHGMTVVGNKRRHNEDAMLDSPQTGMWVVADGMGGHSSGDVASSLIVTRLSDLENVESLDVQTESVCTRLNSINSELCRFAADIEQGSIVGSTVVVLLAKGRNCSVIWAGDSRLYRYRQGVLTQITRDHTLADEMMDSGMITREEALQQVGANVITRAVGGHDQLDLDGIHFLAEAGDRYLLCSDGLDKELSADEISRDMMAENCQSAVENLINHALSKNGRDNITAIVAEFQLL